MKTLVGFKGKAGAGKTTCSTHLVENHGFVRINFKDALVQEMKDNFWNSLVAMARLYQTISITWSSKFSGDATDEELVGFLFQDKPEIMRCFMQNYGTDLRRKENSQYWVDRWSEKVQEALDHDLKVTTDDIRFLNEAEAFAKFGGTIIQIKRENHNPVSTHISETEQDSIVHDYSIMAGQGKHQFIYSELDKILNE